MFLTWNNKADADTSLAAVNTCYGCAYEGDNNYIMASWATGTKSDAAELWGFAAPEERLGKTQAELNDALVAGYTELAEQPSDWITPTTL